MIRYQSDSTKPHPKGKSIGGIAYDLEKIRKSVKQYLGSDDFELVRVEDPAGVGQA